MTRVREASCAVITMLALSACGAATNGRSGPEGPAHDYGVPQLAAVGAAFDAAGSRYLEDCMSSQGYRQLLQARSLVVERTPTARRDPVAADPLEAGPFTLEQARSYGILGTSAAFLTSESGYVNSLDPVYDEALHGCQGALDDARGPRAVALLGQAEALLDRVNADFVREFTDAVMPLVTQRLDCVRQRGYPTLTNDPTVSGEETLASAAVPAGRASTAADLGPREVLPGTVVVLPPHASPTYTPSSEEIAFAETYVACGEEQGFVRAWLRAQAAPRRHVLEEYATRIDALAAVLDEAVDQSPQYSAAEQNGN